MGVPLVSVIIPAYRASRTITRAVDSLVLQTRPPREILVIDDGSPEDLTSILKTYGGRVTVVRKPNGGTASARNLGIDRARGDLIAFLDADDYWEPTKLERQLAIFERHPEMGLVASRYFVETPGESRKIRVGESGHFVGRPLSLSGSEAFDFAATIWTSTIVIRRSALGDQRFESGLEPAEDRDLWFRVVTRCQSYIVDEPLATYVLEPGSLIRSNTDLSGSNMLRVLYKYAHELDLRKLRAWEASIYRNWSTCLLVEGRPRSALSPALSRLRRQPCSADAWIILFKGMALAALHRDHHSSKG